MEIRPYQDQDKNAVVALWNECGLVVPQNDPVKDIERKLEVDPDLFLIGLDGEELVATVMGGYEGHRGWINYLAVKPSQQRVGYGRRIMAAVETSLAQRGCPKINLQVRSSNTAVIEFYQSIGYGDDKVVGLGKRLEHD